jgi:hypothetical protein
MPTVNGRLSGHLICAALCCSVLGLVLLSAGRGMEGVPLDFEYAWAAGISPHAAATH